MARVEAGSRVLDLASGAGSQTLRAARRVGPWAHVVASDISDMMLRHVCETARASGLANVTTIATAAEDLDVATHSFDAVICRLGLMLFAEPARALVAVRRAPRPGGKLAAVVFTTPGTNPFMAEPMRILLRHPGKTPPAPGQPGIFSFGAAGALERLLMDTGFVGTDRTWSVRAVASNGVRSTLRISLPPARPTATPPGRRLLDDERSHRSSSASSRIGMTDSSTRSRLGDFSRRFGRLCGRLCKSRIASSSRSVGSHATRSGRRVCSGGRPKSGTRPSTTLRSTARREVLLPFSTPSGRRSFVKPFADTMATTAWCTSDAAVCCEGKPVAGSREGS